MHKLGIDIGGTKIRAVLWSGKRVLAVRQVKTPKNLLGFRETILQLTTWRLSRQVGIGAAGIISGTKIVFSPNIKYLKNFDFAKLLKGRKIKLDNDARCFARSIDSAGDKFAKNHIILAIALGTGVGRGLVKNGKVLRIKKFEYPETWEKEYQKVRGKPKKNMSNDFAQFLIKKLLPIARRYHFEQIVFGGGVSERNGFIKQMQKAFWQRGMNIKVCVSRFGRNAVAIGAAML